MIRARLAAVTAVTLIAGCAGAGGPISEVRFANRPPVTEVDDRVDTPVKPEKNRAQPSLHPFEGLVYRRIMRALSVPRHERAKNVNSLGNVPDSTWFTRRGELTPTDVHQGPTDGESPMKYRPWKVLSTKAEGDAVGFVIEDTRGVEYIVKFDEKGIPEMETGADVIVNRLMWAMGYHVAEDHIVHFERDDLVLAEDARVETTFGSRPMAEDDLDQRLALIETSEDGTIRGLVSRIVPGETLGGYAPTGTRDGDPNDIVPHQHRRDLRGQLPMFAWLKRVDVKETNTLDSWVRDPEQPGRRYVVHYVIDFGKALGAFGAINNIQSAGLTHDVDPPHLLASLLSLGIWNKPWEDLYPVGIPGVGIYEVEDYDPATIRPPTPWAPLKYADRFDAYWGAKQMMTLEPAHIRAAVEAAEFSDPRATDYLASAILQRQRMTARHYFRQVAPLDRFEVEDRGAGVGLCWSDLALVYRLDGQPETTRYRLTAFDHGGSRTGWDAAATPSASGQACVDGLRLSDSQHGYTIVDIATRRPGEALPSVQVHLARAPDTGAVRVIGLWRE